MATRNDYVASGKTLTQQHNQKPDALMEHRAFMQARIPMLQKWVTQGLKPEALIRFLMLDMSNSEALRKCTPESVYLSLLACAVTGLEPGSLRGEAYIVPFAGKAQFIAGWRGLVKQARRSRDVLGMTANVVRHGDHFEIDLGTANSIVHRPSMGTDRGDIIGAYAIAKMAGGHHEIEWMDGADLDQVKAVATKRGASPAWKEWEDQMFRKSPLRRLAKRLPLGSDYYVGLALEQAADEHGNQSQVLDVLTEGDSSKVEIAGAVAREMAGQVQNDVTEIAG